MPPQSMDSAVAASAPQSMEPSAAPQIVNTIPVKELRPQPDPALPLDNRQRPAQIEEIVVTATKRAEPVRKIAGTVNVLSGEDLEREGVQGIDQNVQQVDRKSTRLNSSH